LRDVRTRSRTYTREGYIRSIIDAVEVDGHATRITGRRDILKPPFSFQNALAKLFRASIDPAAIAKAGLSLGQGWDSQHVPSSPRQSGNFR
jgi:hypothetical protein